MDRGRRMGKNRGGTRAQSPKSNLSIGGAPSLKTTQENAMKHALLVFHLYFLTTSGKTSAISKHGGPFTRS